MKNGQNAEIIKIENRVEAFFKAFSVKNILRHCQSQRDRQNRRGLARSNHFHQASA
jgi:hypothetical protein